MIWLWPPRVPGLKFHPYYDVVRQWNFEGLDKVIRMEPPDWILVTLLEDTRRQTDRHTLFLLPCEALCCLGTDSQKAITRCGPSPLGLQNHDKK
jgi:hypothetical protein